MSKQANQRAIDFRAFALETQARRRGLPLWCRQGGCGPARGSHAPGDRKTRVFYKGKRFTGVTVSIGVADYPAHGDVPAALMKAADSALYAAKESGRNRVVVAGCCAQ